MYGFAFHTQAGYNEGNRGIFHTSVLDDHRAWVEGYGLPFDDFAEA